MQHWFSDAAPFQHDPLQFFLQRGENATGPLERLRLGMAPVWMVTDPEVVRDVLKESEERIDKGRLIHKLRPIVGMSMLTISGEEHARRRHALHATFARSGGLRFVPNMAAAARGLAAELVRHDSFVAHKAMATLSLRMICIVMFGRNVLSAGDEQALLQAVSMVEDDLANELFRIVPPTPWASRSIQRKRDEARKILGMIVSRVKSRCTKDSAVGALEELGLDADDMRDEIVTMLLAGHHTTGSAAAWMLHYLSLYPDIASDIAAEAVALSDETGELDTAKLARAHISLSFVKEVLRLYPSAHWFSREARTDIELGGQRVRKGDALLIVPWFYHRSEKYWDHPTEFRLDRSFSGKSYLPFGAGPRACLGMGVALLELQILALEIAAGFVVRHADARPVGPPTSSVTLVPPEIRLSLRVREPQEMLEAAE